jgi:hypothetical protein
VVLANKAHARATRHYGRMRIHARNAGAYARVRLLARATRNYIDIIGGFFGQLGWFCADCQWYALRTYLHFPLKPLTALQTPTSPITTVKTRCALYPLWLSVSKNRTVH